MASIASHHLAHPHQPLLTRPRTIADRPPLHQTIPPSLSSHSTMSSTPLATMSASQKVHLAPTNRPRPPPTRSSLMALLHTNHHHRLPEHQLISLRTPLSNHHRQPHSFPRTIPVATRSRALTVTLRNRLSSLINSNTVSIPSLLQAPHGHSTGPHRVRPHSRRPPNLPFERPPLMVCVEPAVNSAGRSVYLSMNIEISNRPMNEMISCFAHVAIGTPMAKKRRKT